MVENPEINKKPQQIPTNGKEIFRKPYRKPQLETLGNLHTTTLGGSVSLDFDSGTGTTDYLYLG